MSPKHIVTIAAVLVLGHAAGAIAQESREALRGAPAQVASADPLDAMSQVAALYTGQSLATEPFAAPRDMNVAENYESYMELYAMYLASHAQSAPAPAAPRGGKPGWMSTMQGISSGLAVTDQAIGVYEHAVEAQALANSYKAN